MLIMAVESSCDETAVAIVEDGRKVLVDKIASQADISMRCMAVLRQKFLHASMWRLFRN